MIFVSHFSFIMGMGMEGVLLNLTMKKLDLQSSEQGLHPLHPQLVTNVISVETAILLSCVLNVWTRVSVLLVMKCITNIQRGLVTSER